MQTQVTRSTKIPRRSRVPSLDGAETKRHILAAVDLRFADQDEAILRRAIALVAETPGAMLHAMYVVHASDSAALTEAPGKLEERVVQLASSMRALGGANVGIHVRRGNPSNEIVRFATELGADLIFVGSHHRSALRKWLLGSVSHDVLEGATCGVVVVGGEADALAPPEIEPPCPQCTDTRFETRGAKFWCTRHSEHHLRPHTYSFQRAIPFAFHDSNNVSPTGV